MSILFYNNRFSTLLKDIQPVTEVVSFLTLKLVIEKAVVKDEVPFDVLYGDLYGSSSSR